MSDGAFLRILLATLLAALVWPAISDRPASASNSNFHGTNWKVLRVGGGGWLTGLDISPDGSARVVRTDTYGAYLWNEARQQWTQLVTADSLPVSDIGLDRDAGVYEIRVAPSLPTRLYMSYGGYVYRSDNSGSRWTRTGFSRATMNANDGFRTSGPKMAVDPANPDVVYMGTPRNGLQVSSNGGRTWHTVAGIPASAATEKGEYPGIAGIAFDRSSGTSAGKTRTIFASSYGHGVYRSTDAGASWTYLEGGPRSISHGKIAKDGAYYAIGDEGVSVWRYAAAAWTEITPAARSQPPAKGSWSTVVIDPFDAARVIVAKEGGSLTFSQDRGATWDDGGVIRRTAQDVPWLAWTQESYMSVGDMLLDPITPDRLWFAEGIGVWHATVARDRTNLSPITFISQTAGIEQLVANQIVAPPGGKPVLASWDRPVFFVDNSAQYPTTHGPDNQRAIVMGWALDYAWTSPAFIAGLFNWWGIEKSGFSLDGGRTWAPFASYPPTTKNGKIGGSIAVSTPSNMVWSPSNNANPYYTLDGGVSWKPINVKNVSGETETGWSNAYYLNRHIVAADKASVGTFYLYNYLDGLYRSRDGGANWTLVYSGEIAPYSGFNAKLRSVPGYSGHLYFTSGEQGGPEDRHPAPNPFMRSTDGGTTWVAVDGVLEVRAFGFGKARGSYPAIFVVGWVNGHYGIWRSDDDATSWIKIGEFPLGILVHVTAIEVDGNVAGRVYVGFGGAGYAYGSEQP